MHYIGFDIGGTKCAVSLGKTENAVEIVKRAEIATLPSPQATMEALAPFVKDFLRAESVKGSGVSCGGPLDSKKGVILSPPNLTGWHGFAVCEYISREFGIPARLRNDADACALAEWKYGAGRGCENMVFLTFGTGLGAGLIFNGRLYEGANGNAGEVGHVRLKPHGPCGYGKAGSFEGFCSGGGIARLAADRARALSEMPACVREMGGVDKITAKKLAAYAFDGDAFAAEVFAESGEMLGYGLAALIDTLNPERVVIGGVYMRAERLLAPAMRAVLEREALQETLSACEIVPAALSENVGDYAALAAAEEI
ncbi:MAG: sugar kinase [Bacillota bacterium]|nr:MAG: sugar kinase [Bacillota bacterium]